MVADLKPRLETTAAAWAVFEEGFPDLVPALWAVVDKADGVLEVDVVRSESANANEPVVERVPLGRVQGREVFEVCSLCRRLDEIGDELASAVGTLSRPNLSDHALLQALDRATELVTTLQRAGVAHNAVLAFFADDNVRLVTAWAAGIPDLAESYVKDARLYRKFISREEQIVSENQIVVRAKRNPGKTSKKLIARATAEGWFNELPEICPELFVEETIKRSRRVIRTEIKTAEVPVIKNILPVDVPSIAKY